LGDDAAQALAPEPRFGFFSSRGALQDTQLIELTVKAEARIAAADTQRLLVGDGVIQRVVQDVQRRQLAIQEHFQARSFA
jgi:hypothetical protein